MTNLTLENIALLIIWIMPGFISIKVWSMLVASTRKKASEIIIECIISSFFNIIVYQVGLLVLADNIYIEGTWFVACILILPVIWPIMLKKIMDKNFIKNKIIDPVPKAWDKLFQRGEDMYLIIHMNDGKKIGGYYGKKSYASSYPEMEDIYIEEVWELEIERDEENDTEELALKNKIDGSKGAWVSKNDFKYIEFFEVGRE
ncbi:DUF6338 family protein [Clostridium perfringens]|uniref:DUF6338 family protein n=1 Tax=Clostridium perfringens TaxID=1502 RepID=UPI001CB5B7CD|nr:DUF6338 family protein [Clostridium perfringens]HBI7094621.1 hypothetical protein [Clostridium perfringens]